MTQLPAIDFVRRSNTDNVVYVVTQKGNSFVNQYKLLVDEIKNDLKIAQNRAVTPFYKAIPLHTAIFRFFPKSTCAFDWFLATGHTDWHWLFRHGLTRRKLSHRDLLSSTKPSQWPFYEAGKNVQKRLKTFENIRKYSKILKFWVETFKNIQIFFTPLRIWWIFLTF